MHGTLSTVPPMLRAGSSRDDGFAPSAWVSAAEYETLRAHPALPGAVADFTAALIETYAGNALLNALLCDRGRILVGLYVLYLDVLPLPGTRDVGATLGAVQALCRQTGICSPGRAASVLAAMRFGGYVVTRTDPADRRRRILAPSPKLIAAHERNWTRQFEAMAPVFPGAHLVPARLQDQTYRTAFLRQLGIHFLAGFRVLDHVPVLAKLADSNAGLLLMSSLALRQLAGTGTVGQAVPVSISALSRTFGVARAHVRNMLAISAAGGLLEHQPGSDRVFVRPALGEAIVQFFAVLFILFERCAAGALIDAGPHRRNPDPLN